MNIIQEKLLHLASTNSLNDLSLRQIAQLIGETHPQKVKHHLVQLAAKGLIKLDPENKEIKKVVPNSQAVGSLVSIPIVGSANCGPATIYADERVEGYLKVSNKIIRPRKGLFALRAVGNSMNKARIKGKNIDEGDYVVVDSVSRTPVNNDYVVSIIDGVCNIKKYYEDKVNKQILLLSETTQKSEPIYIHPNDINYLVCGKVVDVVKRPII